MSNEETLGVADRSRVTNAWRRIHHDHPDAYAVHHPQHIRRMQYRDFAKIIARVCPLTPGSGILEAGCGSGRDILYFASLGFACVAVDINDGWLAQLTRAQQCMGNRTSLEVIGADFFSLPFADQTFNLVFNSGVIEHYDQPTRHAVFIEMRRVTKGEGYVCCVFPNREHILDPVWETFISRTTDHDDYGIPERFITPSLPAELLAAGLTPVLLDWIDCYDTISHFPSWFPLRGLSYAANALLPRMPQRLRRKLGTRVLMIAQRIT